MVHITGVKFVALIFSQIIKCEIFSLLFTLTKEFACQLCSNNCSKFHQILLLTLNLLVRLMTEYFHVIFSLGTCLTKLLSLGCVLTPNAPYNRETTVVVKYTQPENRIYQSTRTSRKRHPMPRTKSLQSSQIKL